MQAHRNLATIMLLVLAAMGLAGCAAMNGVLTDRTLTCEETPDELCLRIVDVAVTGDFGPGVTPAAMGAVLVQPTDCAKYGHGPNPELVLPDGRRQPRRPDATRCWYVEGTEPPVHEHMGFGVVVYERPDGTLAVD